MRIRIRRLQPLLLYPRHLLSIFEVLILIHQVTSNRLHHPAPPTAAQTNFYIGALLHEPLVYGTLTGKWTARHRARTKAQRLIPIQCLIPPEVVVQVSSNASLVPVFSNATRNPFIPLNQALSLSLSLSLSPLSPLSLPLSPSPPLFLRTQRECTLPRQRL